MVFIGYQQLTKSQLSDSLVSNSSAANSNVSNGLGTNSNTVIVPNVSTESTVSKVFGKTLVSNSNQPASNIETVSETKQARTKKLQASKYSNRRSSFKFQDEAIAIAEPTRSNGILNNQAIVTKLPSSYNNPMTIDAIPLSINSSNADAESTIEEIAATSYEVIDTDDPNRTIFIANFEIDGNKFRGLKRKVTSLFKNNKSDRNK